MNVVRVALVAVAVVACIPAWLTFLRRHPVQSLRDRLGMLRAQLFGLGMLLLAVAGMMFATALDSGALHALPVLFLAWAGGVSVRIIHRWEQQFDQAVSAGAATAPRAHVTAAERRALTLSWSSLILMQVLVIIWSTLD